MTARVHKLDGEVLYFKLVCDITSSEYFWNLYQTSDKEANHDNERIFNELGIPKVAFCTQHYYSGWTYERGAWPVMDGMALEQRQIEHYMREAMRGLEEYGCKVFIFDSKEEAKVSVLDKFFSL